MASVSRYFLPFLFLLAATCLQAQSLAVDSIDPSGFPRVKALVYPLDANGRQVGDVDRLRVTENGAARRIVDLRCPPESSPQPISAVLTIDVSGSMAYGAPRLRLAQSAAKAWVRSLGRERFECAITSFDVRSYLNNDFTADTSRLMRTIDALLPQGGTDYNQALIEPPGGGLLLARKGRYRRVVVFLTDGQGGGNEEAIVSAALRDSITIYCVTLGMPAPGLVKRIAERTGGAWFEEVTTVEQAEQIYRTISYMAQGGQPCELIWEAEPTCEVRHTVAISLDGRADTAEYDAPPGSVAGLSISPGSLAFGPIAPGREREMTVTLSAKVRPVTINQVVSGGNAARFRTDLPATPFTMQPGETRRVKVTFAPSDSGMTFARFNFSTDLCPGPTLFLSGGFPGRRPARPTLRLVRPNGGEVFVVGEKATLEWEGVSPSDPVKLEYSIDAGATWKTITDKATGLKRVWDVPATPSRRCLARVSQALESDREDSGMVLRGHSRFSYTSAFSPDGALLATGSMDGTVKVWDSRTGRQLRTYDLASEPGRQVYHVEFSPDGSRLLTADDMNGATVKIFDVATGRQLRAVKGYLTNHVSVGTIDLEGSYLPSSAFSPDGTRVITGCQLPRVSGQTNWDCYEPTIQDIATGRAPVSLKGHRSGTYVYSAQFSPDGSRVVTAADDSTARIFDATTGRQLAMIKDDTRMRFAAFNGDGSRIVTVAYNRAVKIWDANTGALLHTIPSRATPKSISLSPDGSTVAVGSRDGDAKVYDIQTGKELMRLKSETGEPYVRHSDDGSRILVWGNLDAEVFSTEDGSLLGKVRMGDPNNNYVRFSPDGDRIARSTSTRGDHTIWDVAAPTAQSDVSDSLWAIVAPQMAASDIDFGSQLVGTARDSVVVGYIRNTGTTPLRVSSIGVSGANASEFAVVSGGDPVIIPPGGTREVEFRFAPTAEGPREAKLEIKGGAPSTHTIRGRGVAPSLAIDSKLIDFGTVPVGNAKDTTVAMVVRNTGAAPVNVSSTVLLGPDTTQFEIVDGGGGFSLSPGESRTMKLRFSPFEDGGTSARIGFRHAGVGSPTIAYLYGEGEAPDERYDDPTTFRTIAIPNAILPKKGKIVIGVYDVLGLMAGYGITDNVMVLGGGGVPLPDDWGGVNGSMYGAYSLGVKAGLPVTSRFNIGAGYQFGRSIYDKDETPDVIESSITVHALYSAFSYGDDDSRVSASIGYAFKHHTRFSGEFDADAYIVALGGDYRFADRWKICAEAMTMRTMGFAPIAVTARWFGPTWALDVGGAYTGITTGDEEAPELPIAPVVSFVWVL